MSIVLMTVTEIYKKVTSFDYFIGWKIMLDKSRCEVQAIIG